MVEAENDIIIIIIIIIIITPRVRRFGIFPSMQSTTKLEQIGSTRDLSATRGKKSAQLK